MEVGEEITKVQTPDLGDPVELNFRGRHAKFRTPFVVSSGGLGG